MNQCGQIDLDADLYEEEYHDIINAINSGSLTGCCYKCNKVGHTIARCPRPPGYRSCTPRGGWGGRGCGRGRGRLGRGGTAGCNKQTGRYVSLNQVEDRMEGGDVADLNEIEVIDVGDENPTTEEPENFH